MVVIKNTNKPAVFFDRDGVLIATNVRNGKPYAIKSIQELRILPHIAKIMHQFKSKGYKIVVITNQPDVGNGLVARSAVEEINSALEESLPIDLTKVCYHRQNEGCDCRKPNIGMFLEAARELNIDITSSIMIGDRASDIEAGVKAGCFTVFINYGYNERLSYVPDLVVSSTSNFFHEIETGVINYP